MVTKRKKRSKTLSLDFSGVESGGRSVPDGTYTVVVEKWSIEEGEDSGKEYIAWEYRVAKGKHKGVKLYDRTSLQPQALWKLKAFIEAHGDEVPDGVMDFNPEDYIGREFDVETTNEEYQGKERSKVTGYVTAGAEEGEEEEDEEEEETEEETEEEEEEEEEEEKPARGKGKRAQARAAKKKAAEEEDDGDEDEEEDDDGDEDEEEDDEEPAPKRGKKSAKTSRSSGGGAFKKGALVKFKEDGKIYKGKVLEVDGSVATVDVKGDEWQVQVEDLTAA